MKLRRLPVLLLIASCFGLTTHADELDKLYSQKQLGSFVRNGKTYFKLFAPSAERVLLLTFSRPEDSKARELSMTRDPDGVWETSIDGEQAGLYYGYRVYHNGEDKKALKPICVDPYARAITTFNTYMSPRRAIVVKDDNYDWGGDTWVRRNWLDLVIYEMHVRDLTAHQSSGAKSRGTYHGLVEKGKAGGLAYITSLGVNTVELLPAQEFANIEIPFRDSLAGRFNTWNPYERNHWGYMTAGFFAPAAYYAEEWQTLEWNVWMGKDARAIREFKDMVKAFHKEGIGVMMDVVYNHISEHELGNLKEIDKEYYFRLDANGNFIAESGCGNDFNTERPMARRLIVESVLFWMREYHIDGFRFDLAKLIDWGTVEEVIKEARKINPAVVIIAEPWGGGYDPAGFSRRGWGAWNDQIRNGVKGQNPNDGHGWIFGKWQGNNSLARLKSYVNGTLVRDTLGIFQTPNHSVNYLESHDDQTLGDFVRIGLGDVRPGEKISDLAKNAKLTPMQLKVNKLGALFLFTSRGATMIHSGQEFARSKVIAIDSTVKDTHQGEIDHNSYNKDNETNYIDFRQARANRELLDYYRGLIELRKKYAAFRRAQYESISFLEVQENPFALGYTIKHGSDEFLVLMNAHNSVDAAFELPAGNWRVLTNPERAGTKSLGKISNALTLKSKEGYVLMKDPGNEVTK